MVLAASRSILGGGGESVNEANTLGTRLESPEGSDHGPERCRSLLEIDCCESGVIGF
jgi:hypothetical protein